MFSQPPINDHAASIISKITDYINQQAKDAYETMSNYICDDFCLTKDETKTIASQSSRLMKMNVYLSEKITIRNQTISTIIKSTVFAHLQKCFDHLSEKVDKYAAKLNYNNAFKKIEESRSLFMIIQQEVGSEIKEMDEYKQLAATCISTTKKKETVKKAIEDVISTLIERDVQKAMEQPQPRAVYDEIAKASEITDMSDKLQLIVDGFIAKYNKEKRIIEEALKASDDVDQLQQIEKTVEKLRDTLMYMPSKVSDAMKTQLNNLIDTHQRQAEVQQERQN